MKILANDGISESGKEKLEAAGYKVTTNCSSRRFDFYYQ